MHNNVKLLLATTVLFFSGQALADSGCNFKENHNTFMATCSKEKQEVIETGIINPQKLVAESDFIENYKNYKADAATIAALKTVTEPTEITVIIGTWCPDCHRETPRFIRIIEALNNPNITVKYIGVDRTKQDPQGLAAKYEFTRIPTFIVQQQNQEIGRIVERPTVSLEKDLAEILKVSI